ncbi:unnamed protein product [Sympodiomycopsis kandeliae]
MTTKRSQTTPAVLKTNAQNASIGSSDNSEADPSAKTQEDNQGPLKDFDAVKWELENVHDVYSSIASHFSATRYKPWPLVTNFLASLPPGSIGVDVGCGNGKYLHLRNLLHPNDQHGEKPSSSSPSQRDCVTIGVDRSSELIDLAQDMTLDKMAANTNTAGETAAKSQAETDGRMQGQDRERTVNSSQLVNEVAVGDGLSTGFRNQAFDYAISIATIHHFSTRQRRKEAIQELIRLVQPVDVESGQLAGNDSGSAGGRGRFLVYVWALEQRGQERRKFDEDDSKRRQEEEAEKGPPQGRDVLVPWVLRNQKKDNKKNGKSKAEDTQEQTTTQEEEPVYQRYYHLFEESELESLVQEAISSLPESISPLTVIREDSGWERGNWWGVWKVCRQGVPRVD